MAKAKIEKEEIEVEVAEEKPAVVEQKKGTRPGWRPADMLPNLKAKSGFTARWVANDPANIMRKRHEGWIVMKPSDNAGSHIESLGYATDSGTLASEIRYQNMIAMMLPDDMKKARDEYHRQRIDESTASILSESDEKMKRIGLKTYTPKGQSGRIVIE